MTFCRSTHTLRHFSHYQSHFILSIIALQSVTISPSRIQLSSHFIFAILSRSMHSHLQLSHPRYHRTTFSNCSHVHQYTPYTYFLATRTFQGSGVLRFILFNGGVCYFILYAAIFYFVFILFSLEPHWASEQSGPCRLSAIQLFSFLFFPVAAVPPPPGPRPHGASESGGRQGHPTSVNGSTVSGAATATLPGVRKRLTSVVISTGICRS